MILVIKHIAIEGPGTLGEFFKERGRKIRTIEVDGGATLPPDLSLIEAVIILGGPMSVYEKEKHPFLREEDIFLKRAVAAGIPTLGICLGAQLLAKACGAKVKKAPEKEIGWHKAALTEEGLKDPLFKGLNRTLEVFQWHEDTFEMPDNAALLAASAGCRNQAARFAEFVYGLQFHIEVTAGMIRDWAEEYGHQNGKEMLARYAEISDTFSEQARLLYKNFEKFIEGRE